MEFCIRQEEYEDVQPIHDLTVAAFLHAPHTDHTEQFVVRALRESGALTVSLVADSAGAVIGHVALSPVTISDAASGWYGLGPLSVSPEEQGKGIGSQLMHAAIAELEQRNASGCVLLGDPAYYSRFGFRPVAGLVFPGVPSEYFQALSLQGDFPRGRVSYHPAFAAQS